MNPGLSRLSCLVLGFPEASEGRGSRARARVSSLGDLAVAAGNRDRQDSSQEGGDFGSSLSLPQSLQQYLEISIC